jgi:hypothetical protein
MLGMYKSILRREWDAVPSGAKAPDNIQPSTYGLKPVPFKATEGRV